MVRIRVSQLIKFINMSKTKNKVEYTLEDNEFTPKSGKIIYTKDNVRHKCFSTRGTVYKNDLSCKYCSLSKYIENKELQCIGCFDFYFKVCNLH